MTAHAVVAYFRQVTTAQSKGRNNLPVYPQVCQTPEAAVHSLPLEVVQAPTVPHSPYSPVLLSLCNNTYINSATSAKDNISIGTCVSGIYRTLCAIKRGVVTPAVPFTVRPSSRRILRGFSVTSTLFLLACLSLKDSKIRSRSDKAGDTCGGSRKNEIKVKRG